ncbi:RNA polymerase sigma factor [Protaetiibacter larvae]|uniref:RNA polymerase sigma factor n=1 Tax=Protaetiibacter larvae TaxID=2592654 RepID=A0A5C1Y8U6_9MICO|nr:RNA polymerase sigma factor [Protaetiibacter larvae]QEO09798.1 RNA polymerase sigma factor [Protaetiibacter larvae]
MYDTAGDDELVSRAIRGDRGAFSALFRRHARAVHAYAWGIVRDDRDAEDVTQEVFVLAWRKVGGLRIVDSSALPWLLVTCRNVARNQVRARREALEFDESVLPGDRVRHERIEELSWARAEIGRLGGVDQRIVHLCLVEGYGYEEAAEHLGLSRSAVAKRVERLRATLRAAVRGEQ